MKFGLALLVLGIITYAVYMITNQPNYDALYDGDANDLKVKVLSSEIYPKSVYTNNSLSIKMHDANKEEYSYVSVKWFRNGGEVTGVSQTTLPAKYTRKGDRIHAEVNLLGPDALEEPVKTETVSVLNTPPVVASGSLTLVTRPTDMIVARITADDTDKDRLDYTYKWLVNRQEYQTTKDRTLRVGAFELGDEISAIVYVTDHDADAVTYQCEPIVLGSNAPVITSQPPSSFTPDRRYVYQLEVTAPDTQTLNFELLKAPEGMKISSTGFIDWELPAAEVGSRKYTVIVKASDASGGEAQQEFTISLSGMAGSQN